MRSFSQASALACPRQGQLGVAVLELSVLALGLGPLAVALAELLSPTGLSGRGEEGLVGVHVNGAASGPLRALGG